MTRGVAIIGAGIGAEHLDGYRAVPERFRVVWICDLDAERGQALAGEDIRWSGDMAQVLADPAVDIVDICLPPHLHFSAAMEALEAGKHVICEKPLAPSLAEVDELGTAAQTAGLSVFPVFQYRYGLGAAQMHALMDAGLAGPAFTGTLETHWNRPASYYDIPWRGTWAGERGGAVLGHAIHIHDLLTCFLGPVARVHAEVATRVNDIEVEDCAALSIRMACGAVVTSSITLGAADDSSRLRFQFQGLTAESSHAPYAPCADAWQFTARAPTEQTAIDRTLSDIAPPPAGYAGLFTAVADALDGAPGREVTLADGRRSVEFVTAVYQSARSGAAVDLPLGPGHPLYSGWLP